MAIRHEKNTREGRSKGSGNHEPANSLGSFRFAILQLRFTAQPCGELRPRAALRRLQRQRAQGFGEVQLAIAIRHDTGPAGESMISRRRCVPRATCDLEKLTLLPTRSAISGCE